MVSIILWQTSYYQCQVLTCTPTATQILLRGLQVIPNPETIFVPQPALLKWAFLQEPLVESGLAMKWVNPTFTHTSQNHLVCTHLYYFQLLQWLKMLTDELCDPMVFFNTLHGFPGLLTHLLVS